MPVATSVEPKTAVRWRRLSRGTSWPVDQVQAILADHRSQRVIAAQYGVSRSAISAIKIGRNWKRTGDDDATDNN